MGLVFYIFSLMMEAFSPGMCAHVAENWSTHCHCNVLYGYAMLYCVLCTVSAKPKPDPLFADFTGAVVLWWQPVLSTVAGDWRHPANYWQHQSVQPPGRYPEVSMESQITFGPQNV